MEVSEIFELLESKETSLVTKKHVRDAFKEFKGDRDLTLMELEDWVEESINDFIDTFTIEELKPIIDSFKKGIIRDFDVSVNMEAREATSMEVKETLAYIFTNLNRIVRYRDQVETTLSYLTVSKKEYISFKKVISDFYSRNLIVLENIKQKKAIEEAVESITLDLSVYKSEIEGGISSLNSCIESLTKKQNLLQKAEQALRLSSKYDEMDHYSNSRETHSF